MHGHAAEKSENDDTGSERRKRHEYDSADHFVLHRYFPPAREMHIASTTKHS